MSCSKQQRVRMTAAPNVGDARATRNVGDAQPTLTIQALAFRAAEHIANFARRGEV